MVPAVIPGKNGEIAGGGDDAPPRGVEGIGGIASNTNSSVAMVVFAAHPADVSGGMTGGVTGEKRVSVDRQGHSSSPRARRTRPAMCPLPRDPPARGYVSDRGRWVGRVSLRYRLV